MPSGISATNTGEPASAFPIVMAVGVLLATLAPEADALATAVVVTGAALAVLVAAALPLLPLGFRLNLLAAKSETWTLAVRLADQLAAALGGRTTRDSNAETLAAIAVAPLEAHLGDADPYPKEADTVVSALLRAIRVGVAHARTGVGHTGARRGALAA
jgi:hypothetical protein